jgi:hypothetical protein
MPQSIAQEFHNAPANFPGVSADELTAWELTRRVSPRDAVRAMKRDAYGHLDVNNYPLIRRVGPVEPTTPWAMNLTDDAHYFRFLCFDFDGKVDGRVDAELMEQAVDQCDALSRLLDELKIAHVVCQSSGTGGRHLWIALRTGVELALVAPIAWAGNVTYSQLDFALLLNAASGAVRPPLSPHRDGSHSTVLRGSVSSLLNPSTTMEDLTALAALLEARKPTLIKQESRPSGPVTALHRTHRPLTVAGAAHMATIGGGGDPSWTAFMCLLSAANAGWTFNDVEHAAKSAPGMEHYRTMKSDRGGRRPRNAREAAARLERQWARAVKIAAIQRPLPSRSTPPDLTELDAIVRDVQDIMERFRVNPGRWGSSEASSNHQTILRALMYLTLHTGKRVVAGSIRDLGPMGGLGRTTANSALPALQEAGYVELVTSSSDGNASEWRLLPRLSTPHGTVRSHLFDNARPQPSESNNPPRSAAELFSTRAALLSQLEGQLADQRHDLFTRGGLGHLAGKLYALLGRHASLTVESAARALGVTSRHTATILGRLRKHKLIVSHKDGWARAKRDLRDQAAKAVGVVGVMAARIECYRIDRVVWAWWQSELATMTSVPRKRPRRPHVSSRPLFGADSPGERVYPRYPRDSKRLADHRSARALVSGGFLEPEARWQYLGDAA